MLVSLPVVSSTSHWSELFCFYPAYACLFYMNCIHTIRYSCGEAPNIPVLNVSFLILLTDRIPAFCPSPAQHGGERGFWDRGAWFYGLFSCLVYFICAVMCCNTVPLAHFHVEQFLSEDRLHYRSQRTKELDSLLGDLHCDIRGNFPFYDSCVPDI